MTEDELIDGILEREGGFVNDPVDHGGVTNFGITAAAWGQYKNLNRPGTVAEMQAITRADAVEFYRQKYIVNSAFKAVKYEPLRAQLIDFAVNSGETRATRWLQRAIGLPATGTLDAETLTNLNTLPPALVNNALVAARVAMYQRIVQSEPAQVKFLRGWINRAVSFSSFAAVNA
jgi:lysozyme family protein